MHFWHWRVSVSDCRELMAASPITQTQSMQALQSVKCQAVQGCLAQTCINTAVGVVTLSLLACGAQRMGQVV
jgi:hypothetical protein